MNRRTMSSKFSTAAQTHSKPPWCRPGIDPVPPVYVAGNPVTIICFAYWLDLNAAPPIDIAESFTIEYRPETNDWYGNSGLAGLRLSIQITRPGPPGTFDFSLKVLRGAVLLDDDSWHNVPLPLDPGLNSGLLTHTHDPGVDQNGLRAVS